MENIWKAKVCVLGMVYGFIPWHDDEVYEILFQGLLQYDGIMVTVIVIV